MYRRRLRAAEGGLRLLALGCVAAGCDGAATNRTSPACNTQPPARGTLTVKGVGAAGEAQWCWTVTRSGEDVLLWQLQLSRGELHQVAAFRSREQSLGAGLHNSSLVRRGDDLIVAAELGGEPRWARLSLRDREVHFAGRAGYLGVATDGETLFVPCSLDAADSGAFRGISNDLCGYLDFAALGCAEPLGALSLPPLSVSRLAIEGGLLYGAWHSTAVIERVDLEGSRRLAAVTLQGFDDWVDGFSVVNAGLYLLSHSPAGYSVAVFDASNGAQRAVYRLQSLGPGERPGGLWCAAGEPPRLD